ncbi:MAG: glycosyltransferase [Actinobacteria bacterium]|nr:glycosyltransferase [Actinomycetota bacterium]NBY15196.1 glycosyltransferase [Actinomycetota bacterium]
MLDEKYVIGICTTGTRATLDLFLDKFIPTLNEHSENLRIVIAINGVGDIEVAQLPNLTVVRELRPGIAYARNRVLQEVNPDENLIFIDDDEYPDEKWFTNLTRAHKQFPTDIIFGPVYEVDDGGEVVKDSKIRPMRNLATGTLLKSAATNNLLIPSNIIGSRHLYFDIYFNRGGSDSDLTIRLGNAGYLIRWVSDAILYEVQDSERSNSDWAYNRNCRNSALYPLVILRNSSVPYIFAYFLKKLFQVCIYFFLQFFGIKFKKKYHLFKLSIKSLLTGDSGLYSD